MVTNALAINVLIIDDDEDDFFLMSDYITNIPGKSFSIDWCPDYNKALEQILEKKHDIYFIDYRLGAKTGLDLLKDAKDHGCEEPIILLTGQGNLKIDIEAMYGGAVEYLVKSEINTEKLERCIRYALNQTATLKALRKNERKYRNMFERSKDVVFIADENFVMRELNNEAEKLLEFSLEELIGKHLLDFIERPEDKTVFIEKLAEKQVVDDWETVIVCKSGIKKNVIITASIEADTNSGIYIQGIIHDITALKRAEKATLYTEKLGSVRRLVRTLAHEVRNPLNNIIMAVGQLLESNSDDEDMSFNLNLIQRNGKRINDLITQLLKSSNPSDVALEKVSLQTVIDRALDEAADRLTLKKIKLTTSFENIEEPLLLDLEKIKIAFLNIIINAIEAMDEGKGELIIEVGMQDARQVVKIIDNGCGISEENLNKLFEPYFTSKRNGMGLGLATTLNILQLHKADIEVISEPMKGTTFMIIFHQDHPMEILLNENISMP